MALAGLPEIAVYIGKNHIFETWRTQECVRSLGFSHSRLTSIPKIRLKFRASRNPTPAKEAGMGHPHGRRLLADIHWATTGSIPKGK